MHKQCPGATQNTEVARKSLWSMFDILIGLKLVDSDLLTIGTPISDRYSSLITIITWFPMCPGATQNSKVAI